VLDYDGETRASLTPVDIGADAGNFIGIDLSPPSITYTPLGNTLSTLNRIQSVNITDLTGVDTGGNAPRIYFNKNAGPYFSTACVLVVGTVTSGTWDCTIDNSLVGGVVAGDVIRYFVVAQDTVGNLASNPSAGFSGTNVNTVLTPPTTPNLYNISFSVSGTYNVGTSETYTSLTNPGGIFEFINGNVVTGDVVIEITSDLTGETGTVRLNQFASPFTVTIKPSGVARSITGTGTGGIVVGFNGADRVTIDGSLSAGSDQSLTITNPNTANGTGALFFGSIAVGAGASDNTVKNCIIQAGSIGTTTNFTFGIFIGDTTGAAAGADNDNITIHNNVIRRARTGLQAVGTAAGVMDNFVMTNNVFGDDVSANSIGRIGLNISTANAANISGNTIKNLFLTSDSAQTYGAVLGAATNSSFSRNTITNIRSNSTSQAFGLLVTGAVAGTTVTRNNINDVRYTGTSGYGGKGVTIESATGGLTLANNFVSGMLGDSWTAGVLTDTINGIRIVGTSNGVNLYNNSVNLGSGDFVGANQATVTMALYVASGQTNLDIRNNIFANNLNNTTVTTDKNYAVYSAAANTAYTSIDYNDYFVSGPAGVLGFLTSDRTDLTGWQTATGQDVNSISANPLFASATDLHIGLTSPAKDVGVTIPSVTNDFDGEARPNGPAYDIGADELVPYTVGGTVSGLVGTGLVLQNNGGDNLNITANGPFTFATALANGSPYNVTVLTQPTGPAQTCTVTNGSGTISGANVTNVQVTCAIAQWPLNVSLAGTGTGSVSSSPAGISCPGDCSENYDDSTVVTLTATADPGSVFTGWSGGGCSGTGTCVVTMTAATSVTATFNLLPQVQFAAATFQDDESQSAVITVTRSVDLTGSSSVDVTLTDITAVGGAACTSGVDYINPGTVTLNFGIGVSTQSFNVTLCGDTLTEPLETVNLALSNPTNAFIVPPSTATLNINDTANQWRNTAPITMNLGTTASLYPSTISVTGAPTSIGAIRVTLYDLYHDFPDHINVLLVGPTGAKFVLMADAGGPGPGIPSANHVTLTFTDQPAPIVPDSAPPTTGRYLPTTWEPVLPTAFPAPAPPAPYPTPGNDPFPSRDVTESMFGQYGLTDGNGTWSLYIVDDAGTPLAPDVVMGEVLGGWGLELLAPTNTAVTVSGRVMTPDGAGLRNAVVSMTDSLGITRRVTTSSLGYYVFTDIPVGDTYVVGVSSRRYRFTTRVVPVLDPIADLDFIGQE
jgi:hypothetical protein